MTRYVVTTKRQKVGAQPGGQMLHESIDCRAVTTLDEAKRRARDPINAALLYDPGQVRSRLGEWKQIVAQVDALNESGGTVGPFPDGTIVEVRRV